MSKDKVPNWKASLNLETIKSRSALANDIRRDRKKNIAKNKGFTPDGYLKRGFGITADEKAQNEANRKAGRRGLGQLKNKQKGGSKDVVVKNKQYPDGIYMNSDRENESGKKNQKQAETAFPTSKNKEKSSF